MTTVQYERRLRLPEVVYQSGLSRTTIYERIKDGTFPAQRKDGNMSYWLLSEVQAWIDRNAHPKIHTQK